MAEKRLTGKHVLAIFVLAFGLIIGVNVLMAYKAISTFPGLEVENSYVASQEFDKRKKAQEALGWTVTVTHDDKELILAITAPDGSPVEVKELKALVGHTTSTTDDFFPEFTFDGQVYRAPAHLAAGTWLVKLDAMSKSDVVFEQRLDVLVRG